MHEGRVTVSTVELEHAVAVWLAVAPRPIVERLKKQLLLAEQKRQDGDPIPEFRAQLAHWVAHKLTDAGWEVTRPDRAGPLFG